MSHESVPIDTEIMLPSMYNGGDKEFMWQTSLLNK